MCSRTLSSFVVTALLLAASALSAQQPATPSPQTRIALDPAQFDRYAGYYQLGPRIAMRLFREDSRFYMGPVGTTQRREIFAETPESFSVANLPVTIRFKPGANESVAEAIFNQAGRDIIAPRITEQAAMALMAAAQTPSTASPRNWTVKMAVHRVITNQTDTVVDYWPSFTPDGLHIIFTRSPDAGRNGSLWRVTVATGSEQQLFERAGVSATRSHSGPDGRIAFLAGVKASGPAIWTMNGDGSGAHAVPLKDIITPTYPYWHPDGRSIAFVDGARNILFRADVASGVATPITRQSEVLAGMPSISPDGKWIAFAGQKNNGQLYNQNDNQIWLVDESGAARTLEANPGPGRTPSWSPDGKRIAFESGRGSPDGHYALFIVNRDGTGLMQVTDYALNGNHPVWSPDGKSLAFSWGSEPGKPNGIAVLAVSD
jgi:dipeptidyl aminopeptidase/acylaminoacyl peptidase